MAAQPLHVGVELGGTKIVVGTSTGGPDLEARTTIATGEPESTLGAVRDAIVSATRGRSLSGVGIGTFGPIDLRPSSPNFGRLVNTPKPGWSGVDIVRGVRGKLETPIALDTDVNAALLAEHRWGAATADEAAYLTIGTGIGGGVWAGGGVISGANHPEIGHLRVPRHPNDSYAGGCPYHGGCLEGMASGSAINERWGSPADALGPGTDEAVAMISWYVAQGIAGLCAVVPVTQVVVGGGVSRLPEFHTAIAGHLEEVTGGYPPVPFAEGGPGILSPGLGDDSGVIGAIELSRSVLQNPTGGSASSG
ncbi:MAG: ROK family protein [Actinomycetia bacterium]|nr:ROK family protein [Actinomycetes bacterium]